MYGVLHVQYLLLHLLLLLLLRLRPSDISKEAIIRRQGVFPTVYSDRVVRNRFLEYSRFWLLKCESGAER